MFPRLSMAVVLSGLLLLALSSCEAQTSKSAKAATAKHQSTSIGISIAYNNGNCVQYDSTHTAVNFIPVARGDTITWQSSDGTPIDVQFAPVTPFSYYYSSGVRPVVSGPTSNKLGGFPYYAVTINGNPCQNAYTLGIIMR